MTCGKWIVAMAAYGSDDVGHLTCTGGDESRALDREKSRSYLVWIDNSMQVDRCKNGRNVHVSAL